MFKKLRPAKHGTCPACGVLTPKFNLAARCRCCAADEDPFDVDLGADTPESVELLPPAPAWPKGVGRYPRAETYQGGRGYIGALWWMPRGRRWVPQHPLEYPRDRLKGLSRPTTA